MSSGSMPSSASACAPSASCSVSCLATSSASSSLSPLSTYSPASSSSSSSGSSLQLAALLLQQRQLGVLLGAHRDVLPGGHAERARGQPGHARDQDRAAVAGRPGDAHHDARGRDDAVVGAEHAGPEPVEPVVQPTLVRLVLVRPGLQPRAGRGRPVCHGSIVASGVRRGQARQGSAARHSLGCSTFRGISRLTTTRTTATIAEPTNVVWIAGSRIDGSRCSRSWRRVAEPVGDAGVDQRAEDGDADRAPDRAGEHGRAGGDAARPPRHRRLGRDHRRCDGEAEPEAHHEARARATCSRQLSPSMVSSRRAPASPKSAPSTIVARKPIDR